MLSAVGSGYQLHPSQLARPAEASVSGGVYHAHCQGMDSRAQYRPTIAYGVCYKILTGDSMSYSRPDPK